MTKPTPTPMQLGRCLNGPEYRIAGRQPVQVHSAPEPDLVFLGELLGVRVEIPIPLVEQPARVAVVLEHRAVPADGPVGLCLYAEIRTATRSSGTATRSRRSTRVGAAAGAKARLILSRWASKESARPVL